MPQTALITGAAKRVGRAIALHLARNGYDILFTYNHSQNEANSLVEEIQSLGQHALAIQSNFQNPKQAVDLLVDTLRFCKTNPNRQLAIGNWQFDRLDLLIHSAGLFEPDDPAHLLDQSRTMMALHFETPLLLVHAFKDLLQKCHGHVIHLTDILADRPWHTHSVYCASKAALVSLIKSQARQLAPDVTVNGIAPGVVDWPADYSEELKQKYLQKVPLGRAGTPDEVAKLVLFLATEGSYITGQIIKLDGGRSIV